MDGYVSFAHVEGLGLPPGFDGEAERGAGKEEHRRGGRWWAPKWPWSSPNVKEEREQVEREEGERPASR